VAPAPAPTPEPDTPTDTSSEEEVPGVGTASVIDPGEGAAINNQGYGILQDGDPAGALPYFQRAITYFPSGSSDTDYSYTLYNLGVALTQLGRGDEAVPYLELRLERWDDRDSEVQATLDEAEAQG
jgi:tetratricopeptide (TPR) repeat protein